MTPPPDRNPAAPTPNALAAFLRGIERRGAVFAQLQAGDPGAGDAALAAAMRAFAAGAASQPMAHWPHRFWHLLLAAPRLRRQAKPARDDNLAGLSELAPGARAVLLLRLAAGLDQAESARVLDIDQATCRRMLHQALPRHPDGRADPAAWQRLRTEVHGRIKTLPAERLAHLARLREAALAAPGSPQLRPRETTRTSRWLKPLLWLLLALCGAALVASFVAPQLFRGGVVDGVRRDRLPSAEQPVARFDAQTALLTHRDFAMLADPDGMAAAEDLAFFSWLAAQPDAVIEGAVVESSATDSGGDDAD